MKFLHCLCITALFAASAGMASADTLTLASYGSTDAAPTGVSNTATKFDGGLMDFIFPISGGRSYNIGTGGVWAAPTGNSSWVSNNPQNFPGGSNVEPLGEYTYSTTFMDTDPGASTGTLTVLADDTASVYLNGVLITPAALPLTMGNCDAGTPNCTSAATYSLTGFDSGLNTLSFDVLQEHGSAEGVDFSGTVSVNSTAVTPEPNSLLLLGTGLLAMGSLLYRRVHA